MLTLLALDKNSVKTPPLSFVDDILGISECGTKSVKMNSFIEAKIEDKQLELGQSKCFQMHVGKSTKECSKLSVHGREMQKTKKEKYLGDILSSSGKIDDNINERFKKGLGIINEIMSIIKEVSFGYHYFEIGILFRNSKLINGIMCSIEALYGLTTKHIEILEKLDRDFFRKLFKSGASTPIESFYLSTNTMPLRFIIIGRRLMFYWSILQKSESELVRRFLTAQELNPVKNDLCLQFKDDMKTCNITLNSYEISTMKKSKFKKVIYSQLREVSREYLLSLKRKHTKLQFLQNTYTLDPYLSSNSISTEEKQTLFKLRTRMIDVKSNFRTQYGQDLACRFCPEEETQSHLLLCNELIDNLDTSSIEYEDIFKDLKKQEAVARLYTQILKIRDMKLKIVARNLSH